MCWQGTAAEAETVDRGTYFREHAISRSDSTDEAPPPSFVFPVEISRGKFSSPVAPRAPSAPVGPLVTRPTADASTRRPLEATPRALDRSPERRGGARAPLPKATRGLVSTLLYFARTYCYALCRSPRVQLKRVVWQVATDLGMVHFVDHFPPAPSAASHPPLPLVCSLSLFFTLVTGHTRSLSLKLSDTRVYEP